MFLDITVIAHLVACIVMHIIMETRCLTTIMKMAH
nr:MAG TPA: hypothetical protein [Caudoviricetes sp.]